jgi:cytochrome c oxidase cbb3-type subunit 3
MADQKQDQDRLLEHDYDGIREYDNPMPRWWLWIFYATIIFVPLYYVLPYPFGEGEGAVAQYEADMAAHAAAAPPQAVAVVTDSQLLALRAQPRVVAEGKAVYDANCAACHRPDGGGLIGPNLTDSAWIHGGAPTQIHHTVSVGVLAKGMPPWERILRPEQVNAVTAYVLSLAGTNPPNPKAPEGPAPAVTGGS